MDIEGEAYKVKCVHLINLAKNSGLDAKKSEAVIDTMIDVIKSRLGELSGGQYAASKATAAMIKDKIGGNISLLI
ncbi:hypothetical protein B9T12_04870 [Wohlfahrtiimonas chitiniclastica]|uniref:hypothetical protein n=1 Tax=Wohlfahrtiimonas TaxID=582472 RepID=UPI000B986AEC|nr:MULTISPECIES: hypothetical protein [Wohlfahrtiimonas]OYQ75478.1 hypothetical protein B9T20_01905 [Wohlfahrtiimonas sp. G9077]OYQ79110.1 hypothetical protein B9T12_04870 [Wohlfahrtiimonas chitiniclastica]